MAGAGLAKVTGVSKIGCFTADTPILMADDTLRPISEVRVGDRVSSFDPESGQIVAGVVEETFVHEDVPTLRVTTAVVGSDGIPESLGEFTSTATHPVYVEGRGYVPVSELHNGDRLRSPDGSLVEVVSIQATGKSETVYNFTGGGTNSYFISDGVRCVLVHNSCTWDPKASRWRDTSNGRFVARPTSPSELVNNGSVDFNDVQQWASQGNLPNRWGSDPARFSSGGFKYSDGDATIWGHGADP